MDHVPNEIISHTLSFLQDDHATLRHCALVTSVWRRFAQPLLFCNVNVTSYDSERQLRKVFEVNGALAKHVRKLTVDGGSPRWDVARPVDAWLDPDRDGEEDSESARCDNMWYTDGTADYLLRKCESIKSVELVGGLPGQLSVHALFTSPALEQCHMSGNNFLVSPTNVAVQPLVIPSSLLSIGLSLPDNYVRLSTVDFKILFSSTSIRHLTISGVRGISRSDYLAVFRRFVPRLEWLSINFAVYRAGDEAVEQREMWATPLLPLCTHLETLRLSCGRDNFPSAGKLLRSAPPQLATIELFLDHLNVEKTAAMRATANELIRGGRWPKLKRFCIHGNAAIEDLALKDGCADRGIVLEYELVARR